MFSEDELAVIDKLAAGKRLTDDDRELVPGLKEKLGAEHQADLADRFVAVTGWTNPPKDYPV